MNAARSLRMLVVLTVLSWLSVGCATRAPYQTPIPMQPIKIGSGEKLATDRVIVIFDSSGSIDARDIFPADKAWVESFVQGMPDGKYDATLLSFGGKTRRGGQLAPFNRTDLATRAHNLDYIGEGTPLDSVLKETGSKIEGVGGRTAIVLLSDGIPDRSKWGDPANPTLAAAEGVTKKANGQVCFHTVLSGEDTEGQALLQSIAKLTPCGSYRPTSSLSNAAGISALERAVFVTAAPKPKVVAPKDADGDGVVDSADACPGTPVGAQVGRTGCWTLKQIRFASGSAAIQAGGQAEITQVSKVMNENRDLKIRIDGYTDSTGSAALNARLSQQRADAVKAALVQEGVPADQLTTKGHGPANPIGDNATAAGRAENRRIEFTILK